MKMSTANAADVKSGILYPTNSERCHAMTANAAKARIGSSREIADFITTRIRTRSRKSTGMEFQLTTLIGIGNRESPGQPAIHRRHCGEIPLLDTTSRSSSPANRNLEFSDTMDGWHGRQNSIGKELSNGSQFLAGGEALDGLVAGLKCSIDFENLPVSSWGPKAADFGWRGALEFPGGLTPVLRASRSVQDRVSVEACRISGVTSIADPVEVTDERQAHISTATENLFDWCRQ